MSRKTAWLVGIVMALSVIGTTLFSSGAKVDAALDVENTYANAPETLNVDASPGVTVTLTHESGLTLKLETGASGLVTPPLLWDGAWQLTTPGASTRHFTVGEPLARDRKGDGRVLTIGAIMLLAAGATVVLRGKGRLRLGGGVLVFVGAGMFLVTAGGTDVSQADYGQQLNDCWLAQPLIPETERQGTKFEVTAAGARCSQALMFTVATTHGYPAAEQAITRAKDLLGDEAAVWGWYCHLAGDSAASGAVGAGADPRALMLGNQSFCDYSVSHGVGAMVVSMHATDPGTALSQACAPDPDSDIPPESYASQCWHGGGMGLARLYRLDLERGLTVCLTADAPALRMNCIEGLFAFGRDYQLRVDDGSWPALSATVETCSQADVNDASFLETCYRSAAIVLVKKLAATASEPDELLRSGLLILEKACVDLPAGVKRRGCWSGVANFTAGSLQRDISDRDMVQRYFPICTKAPDSDESRKTCFQRMAIGLVKNDQQKKGLAVSAIVAMLPTDLQLDIERDLNLWLASISGRSS